MADKANDLKKIVDDVLDTIAKAHQVPKRFIMASGKGYPVMINTEEQKALIECPHCDEVIEAEAIVTRCPHCYEAVEAFD